ncbi:hypothetical protein [Qipengyuania soli]|uniref:META domain-containing protein n=1 Tax=Qipengyuania soli TaxID=2782568 RepID=A0A7S8IV35_9SPHN|nr:hypothetical protein [Qipengyuania soli]QPC98446.1 hypothetical protein IRL76_11415 [Qipengyuania soli]
MACMLLSGACTPANDSQTHGPVTQTEITQAAVQPAGEIPETIVGEYRLAGIDGEDLNSPTGMAVSIGEDTISFEPKCLGSVWTYSLSHGDLRLERDPRYGPQKNKDGSIVSCLPAVTPEYGRLSEAFSAVEKVRRTPANALEFSGGGHSVTLFSQ